MADPSTFKNRAHAGKLLALALRAYAGKPDAMVLALPRGGVPVGFAVAGALGLALDVLLVRKLGLPGHEEFAMGAIAGAAVRVLNREAIADHRIAPGAIDAACAREAAENARRERQYRGGREPVDLHGRTAVLVDDGLATGSTMRAAVSQARLLGATHVVVAVPVGPPDTCAALAAEVDELVCLKRPPLFFAVSHWYRHFDQTSDAEVQDLLAIAWRERARQAPLAGSSHAQ